jgi:hypothetical protein
MNDHCTSARIVGSSRPCGFWPGVLVPRYLVAGGQVVNITSGLALRDKFTLAGTGLTPRFSDIAINNNAAPPSHLVHRLLLLASLLVNYR